ncbi:MAG: RES family NAD+ phosphorylase [Candidatus Solibacter usitatus]|nr:RES family NAD+ phosphorylase [Candidatus Solibacter usitatus]
MILWRVSNHPNLDGTGGLRASGRWHTQGRRIVYCALNPATALVEVMVHLEIDAEDLPESLQYLEIDVPLSVSMETLDVGSLGETWQSRSEVTRRAGDEWLRSGRTALLRVPSVVVPATWNFLINPLHSESSLIHVLRVHQHSLDRRLTR